MIRIVIDNLLTEEYCNELIKTGEEIGFTSPTVKTERGEMVRTDIRNNGRVIIDSPELAEQLFNMFKDQLPQNIDGWELKGLNEQLKIYKYDVGQQFKMHKDVPFVRNDRERSILTMLIYLNEGYDGGETFFMDGPITPATGKCVVFQQNIMHAGMVINEGIKYAIRTDVMYEKF